jgi:hypothetical protein
MFTIIDQKNNKNRGFMVLTMILLVCATVLIIVTSILLRSVGQINETISSEKSIKAWGAVNACGEYALGKMIASTSATTTASNWSYAGNENLNIPLSNGEETCYIYPVIASGTTKIIRASSTVSSFTRKIVIEVATNTPTTTINHWNIVADF